MMYLIPKNIKVKREIFKGFGIFEIILIGISFVFGYVLSMLVNKFKLKFFIFIIFPMITFILLLPLPNGSTILKILKKFIKYSTNQKEYKTK